MSHGRLNPAELQCCGKQMQPNMRKFVYLCPECYWGVTEIEFMRSAHLPNVTQAIAKRELGQQFTKRDGKS